MILAKLDLNVKSYMSMKITGKNSLNIKKEDEILFFEDKRDLWREDKYNLCLNFSLRIKDHSLLFGDNKSVHEDSKIAIIVEVISRESRFRKVIKLTRFSKNQFNSNHGGTLLIEPRSLKGSFDVQVSFVIDEEIYTEKRFLPIANKKGIVVGTFLLQTITLEGHGSNFPVVNFHDKNAPLWHTRVLYDDIDEKPFNECITIALNVDHKNYCYIDEKNDKFIQAYLNEVVSSAIISILTELKTSKKDRTNE